MELRGRVLPEAAHLGYSISIVEILKMQRLLITRILGARTNKFPILQLFSTFDLFLMLSVYKDNHHV